MQFAVRSLAISEVLLLELQRFADERGVFIVTYEKAELRQLGLRDFVQDNEALSHRAGTVRGLHFQRPPHAQGKLVRVVSGAIFDVAVDLRAGSATFGKWVAATLTAAAGEQLYVPRGFAHGYCTLADATIVAYKCDDFYSPRDEGGIHFADPALGIEWPVAAADAILSAKDRALPSFAEATAAMTEAAR